MRHHVRRRFWLEAAVAATTGGLLVLTLITREWIEVVFGVEPDGGSGALEWLIVAVLAIGTIIAVTAARLEWRRPLAQRAHPA